MRGGVVGGSFETVELERSCFPEDGCLEGVRLFAGFFFLREGIATPAYSYIGVL